MNSIAFSCQAQNIVLEAISALKPSVTGAYKKLGVREFHIPQSKCQITLCYTPQTHSQQGFEANVTYKCQNLTFRHFLKTQKSSVTRLYQGLQRFVVECQNGLAPRGKISRDFSSVYAPHSEKTLLCAQHPIYKYIGRVTLSPIIFISGCVGGDEKNIIISSTQNDHVPSSPNGLVLSLDLGTQTRWAVGGHDGIMSSGTKSHKPSRFEGLRSNCSVKKCREAF